MARVSGTSNPTGLREIARKNISISKSELNGKRTFSFTRIDLGEYNLPADAKLIVVARAGNTSIRHEIGTVEHWLRHPLSIESLDTNKPIKFRLLVRSQDSPTLIATAENLRCHSEDDVDSLLPIVASDLGQRLWRLIINEEGPLLQCNASVFPSGASAAGYQPFATLVLPEALRQILQYLADDPERYSSEGTVWADWAEWMRAQGIESPEGLNDEEKTTWVDDSTAKFCDTFRSADALQRALGQGEGS